MTFEPLGRLIDPVTGNVLLRLVPLHLERLHGPYPPGTLDGGSARANGLPFPFLPNAEPIDIVLRGGISPSEIGTAGGFEPNSSLGTTSWWGWDSYR